jgi:S1-C subfamily serine protease
LIIQCNKHQAKVEVDYFYLIMRSITFITTLLLCVPLCDLLRAQEPSSAIDTATAMQNVLVDVIGRCEKSVVAIARVRKDQPGEAFQMEFRPDPFGKRPMPLAPLLPTDPDFIPNQYGAGVVVDPRGLILTTYDLLGDESEYYVTTADRKTYKATIKGADPRSNLAVLKIDAVDLTPITFGNAAELKKGQIVISLGNPYAIARDGQSSAAWGIVANLARKAPATPSESDPSGHSTLHHYGTLIQTDAKLNLGASGGPLLNLKGEMVGLSILPAATAGYEAAGGYAIPVDETFRRIVETLKLGREVEYGFLGIQPQNLQPQEILGGLQGMRVGQVLPGTPAARYGLKAGDIVTEVDSTPLHDADGLVLNVGKLPTEAVARLSVLRDGKPRVIEVTLTKYAVRGKKIVTTVDPAWRGLRVDYPSAVADEAGHLHEDRSLAADAVIVIEVAENSPTYAAGLRRGMLISHVDHLPVRTPKEFAAAVSKNAGPVQLRLAGDKKTTSFVVESKI